MFGLDLANRRWVSRKSHISFRIPNQGNWTSLECMRQLKKFEKVERPRPGGTKFQE
jgi:hypothetical protein